MEWSADSHKKVRLVTATNLTVLSAMNKIKELVGRHGVDGTYVDTQTYNISPSYCPY